LLKKVRWWYALLLLPFLLLIDISYFIHTSVIPREGKPVIFSLAPGTSYWDVAQQLHAQQLLTRPYYWVAIMMLEGKEGKLKIGDYRIVPGEKPLDILAQMVSGKVVLYAITIPEGWTFAQMTDLINRHPYLKHTVSDYAPSMIMFKLGFVEHPEGHFFPSTYYFGRWTTDKAVLVKAHQTMAEKLSTAWQDRAPSLPYANMEQALIVASLIEKEAAKDQDRPLIAGVILNRLKKHMFLQIDASVIYGLGNRFQGKLTRHDLMLDTPYNTYLHKGLPPTPIALPGAASIHAALHPAETNALFYVARGDGTHQFSRTLQEHHRAVNKYIKSRY